MPVTNDTALVANRLIEGLSKCDADIFDRVVCINVQVTPGDNIQVNLAMACDLIEHMLKKRQSGIERALTRAVEGQRRSDLGLECLAIYRRLANTCLPLTHAISPEWRLSRAWGTTLRALL